MPLSSSANAVYGSADHPYLSQNTEEHVPTYEGHMLSGLELLATISSSQNIRWNDTGKHHYLDPWDNSRLFAKHPPRCLQGPDDTRCARGLVVEVTSPIYDRISSEASSSLSCHNIPSSPTLYSSPIANHNFFSTPPRSSTLAASSPMRSIESDASKMHRKTIASASDFEAKPTHTCDDFANFLPSALKLENTDDAIACSPPKIASFLSLVEGVDLSPLSSLMSSPLMKSTFEAEPSVSAPSSPVAALQQRQSMWTHTNPPHECSLSEAASLEPTHQKKRRKTLRSPLTSPSRIRNTQCRSSTAAVRAPTRKKLAPEKDRRLRKHAMVKTNLKTKAGDIVADQEKSPNGSILEKMSKISLDNLAMTGFLVETLALSRASTMVPSELLRAVLKSQPQLKEEHSEDNWVSIIQEILHGVRMFGKVKRRYDAKDNAIEDEWFYIPEHDGDQNRANLLKGLMLPKRAVTKQPKQYYFKPVEKLTRWDPQSD